MPISQKPGQERAGGSQVLQDEGGTPDGNAAWGDGIFSVPAKHNTWRERQTLLWFIKILQLKEIKLVTRQARQRKAGQNWVEKELVGRFLGQTRGREKRQMLANAVFWCSQHCWPTDCQLSSHAVSSLVFPYKITWHHQIVWAAKDDLMGYMTCTIFCLLIQLLLELLIQCLEFWLYVYFLFSEECVSP